MKLKCVYLALLLGLPALTYAGGPDVVAVNNSSPTVANVFYCPAITTLTKDETTSLWSAPNGWQSHDMSFVDKITRFSGAQWRGTNVGQIFCVYRGEADTMFPVLLAYKVLAYAPQGGRWSANLGGYQNCETANEKECPFSIRLKPQEVDIYEQAEQLKRTAPKTSRPGF